jgi:hypothetical protein
MGVQKRRDRAARFAIVAQVPEAVDPGALAPAVIPRLRRTRFYANAVLHSASSRLQAFSACASL